MMTTEYELDIRKNNTINIFVKYGKILEGEI